MICIINGYRLEFDVGFMFYVFYLGSAFMGIVVVSVLLLLSEEGKNEKELVVG